LAGDGAVLVLVFNRRILCSALDER